MSIHISKAVWQHSRARGSARLVLLYLADCADKGGVCWPSQRTIAARTGLSLRHVKRLIPQLVEAGEVAIEQRGSGRGHRARYRICLPAVAKGDRAAPQTLDEKGDSRSKRVTGRRTKGDRRSRPSEPSREPSKEPSVERKKQGARRKGQFVLPPELNSPDFVELWQRWEQHRREMGRPLTRSARAAMLEQARRAGREAAGWVIRLSIENGWQGLFWERLERRRLHKGPDGSGLKKLTLAEGERLNRELNAHLGADWNRPKEPVLNFHELAASLI